MNSQAPINAEFAQATDHVIVEFFGLPGSGKTTIARELHGLLSEGQPALIFSGTLLQDDHGASRRVVAKLPIILAEVCRGSGFGLMAQAFEIEQPSLRDRVRAVSTVATVASVYARLDRLKQSAILDQGILQAIWTVQLRASSWGEIPFTSDALSTLAHARHVVVLVDADKELCARRLEHRASRHSRMQDADPKSAAQQWDRAADLFSQLKNQLEVFFRSDHAAPRVLTIDATATPALSARRIAEFLGATELPREARPKT